MTELPLIRQAIGFLPKHRQRRLTAATQAPWFEDDLKAEIRRRADVAKGIGQDAAATLDRERNEYLRALAQWRHEDAKVWREISFGQDRAIELLEELAREVRALREAIVRRRR